MPPPKALRKGTSHQSSPVPEIEVAKPVEPVPQPPEPVRPPDPPEEPPVVAPIASKPADAADQPGVLEETPDNPGSRGPGAGGGVGTGSGTGIGEGDGPGVGPGSGGGTGGGPYRPGSGIEPPRLLREIRADYTEEARRRGVQGEVLLEIVVRRDGSVGDVRLMQGLGYGLDRQAIDAVRQWRFAPARRFGSPVDVLVEVAVEFRLR
jgi:TonB family protein